MPSAAVWLAALALAVTTVVAGPSHEMHKATSATLEAEQHEQIEQPHSTTVLRLPMKRSRRQLSRAARSIPSEISPLGGRANAEFVVELVFGAHEDKLLCVVDTGSSNLAVAASPSAGAQAWISVPSSAATGQEVAVKYVASSWEANVVVDRVAFAFTNDMFYDKTPFGAIYSSQNFFGTATQPAPFQGILGLAYTAIAQPQDNPVPPFFDLLVQHQNVANVFSLEFCDENPTDGQGQLVLGGVPSAASTGNVTLYTPIVKEEWYTVEVTSMAVDGQKLPLNCGDYNSPGPSIVDSGTTDLAVPTAVFNALVNQLQPLLEKQLPGGDADQWKGFFAGTISVDISRETLAALPSITVSLASTTKGEQFDLTIPPHAYLRLLEEKGKDLEERQFAIVEQCQPMTGMTLGLVVMANYYVVFDRKNLRVGFVNNKCPVEAPLKAPPPLTATYPRSGAELLCKPNPAVQCGGSGSKKQLKWLIWTAVGIGSLAVVAILIIKLRLDLKFYKWLRERKQQRLLSNDHSFEDSQDDEMVDYDYGGVQVFKTGYTEMQTNPTSQA